MRLVPCPVLVCAAVALLALADRGHPAPVPRPRAEAAGPVTANQLKQSANHMRLIALAFHQYHDAYTVLPTNQLGKDNSPLLSWRVQILPFAEQEALYKQFKLDEPWDSEHNKKLIGRMPALYAPVRVKADRG